MCRPDIVPLYVAQSLYLSLARPNTIPKIIGYRIMIILTILRERFHAKKSISARAAFNRASLSKLRITSKIAMVVVASTP
jgi:hypothetical protein